MNLSPRNIPTVWVSDLKSPEEIEDFKKRFNVWINGDIGQRLIDILAKELKAVTTTEVKVETYDNPSWSHQQAHFNGYRQATMKLLKLLGE